MNMHRWLWTAAALTALSVLSCKKEDARRELLEGPAWRLHTMLRQGEILVVPDSIEVTARFEGGTMGGVGGCNAYGANYTVQGSRLRIFNLIHTEIYCHDASALEGMYFMALSDTQSFNVSDTELRLVFRTGELHFHKP